MKQIKLACAWLLKATSTGLLFLLSPAIAGPIPCNGMWFNPSRHEIAAVSATFAGKVNVGKIEFLRAAKYGNWAFYNVLLTEADNGNVILFYSDSPMRSVAIGDAFDMFGPENETDLRAWAEKNYHLPKELAACFRWAVLHRKEGPSPQKYSRH